MSEQPLYVYGIVGSDVAAPRVARLVEPSRGTIFRTLCDGVAALVSEVKDARVRPTKANLDAHQMVVEEASRSGTVIPMRFGVVVGSANQLTDGFLRSKKDALIGLLRQYADRVELRVEAQYREFVGLNEAVQADPRIRRLAQRVRRGSKDGTYYERLSLGELVAAVMQRRAEDDARKIGAELASVAQGARRLPSRNEDTVFRGAFLVHKDRRERFEQILTMIADRQTRRMTFRLIGPLAPWDFTELSLSEGVSPQPRHTTGQVASWAS